MSTNWTWGTGVKALRGLRDWTQTDLAQEAGVPQSTISRIENGSTRISDAVRIKIAKALAVDPNKLFPYREERPDLKSVAS